MFVVLRLRVWARASKPSINNVYYVLAHNATHTHTHSAQHTSTHGTHWTKTASMCADADAEAGAQTDDDRVLERLHLRHVRVYRSKVETLMGRRVSSDRHGWEIAYFVASLYCRPRCGETRGVEWHVHTACVWEWRTATVCHSRFCVQHSGINRLQMETLAYFLDVSKSIGIQMTRGKKN